MMETQTLLDLWNSAVRSFPASGGYGIEIGRHASGFYQASIHRRYSADGPFHMLSYCTADSVTDALREALTKATRNLSLGIDWLTNDLPKEAA